MQSFSHFLVFRRLCGLHSKQTGGILGDDMVGQHITTACGKDHSLTHHCNHFISHCPLCIVLSRV